MKNFLVWISIILLLQTSVGAQLLTSQTFDDEFEEAVQWMYTNELTKYNTTTQFLPAETLTREQAAKFFGNFAIYLGKEPIISQDECQFTDIANADRTLTPHILSSCMLGLFKGFEGTFMPFDTLTRAEAITVVIRTLERKMDETGTPRWSEYHKTARQLGLTTENDVYSLDQPITRYEIALILYRASGENTPDLGEEESLAQIEELKSLLLSLGLMTQ